MELQTSNKGKVKMTFNGFAYHKRNTNKHFIAWRCVKRVTQCKGTLKTSLDMTNPEPLNAHNHEPNHEEIAAMKTVQDIKSQAGVTREAPTQIINERRTDLPEAARPLLGRDENLKGLVQRARKRNVPPVPDSLEELHIRGEWTETADTPPQRFLIHDNGPNANSRLIIFASAASLQRLASVTMWFMDGNFAMSPAGFLQLYVIRVPIGNTAISVVYALMQRKSQAAYSELFQALLGTCEPMGLFFDPASIMCDFEQAVIRAIGETLGPDIDIRACFYHLTQATWRKIQELGLAPLYRNSEEFRLFCGKLDGLAFLPIDEVEEGLAHLRENIPEGAEELVNYFAATYVTGVFRRANQADPDAPVRIRRIPPRFPPHLWNVHEATINDEPRTNNQCEGWNHRFTHIVGHVHPCIWSLIRALQQEDAAVRALIAQDRIGAPPKKRVRRAYQQMQQRLAHLCQDRASGARYCRISLRCWPQHPMAPSELRKPPRRLNTKLWLRQ